MQYNAIIDMVNAQLCPNVMLANINKLPEHRQMFYCYQREINSDLGNIPYHKNVAEIVQAHQVALSKLSNTLFDFRRSLEEDEHPNNRLLAIFYTSVMKGFDDLLGFLIKEYPNEVHSALLAPYSYVSLLSNELRTIMEKVQVQALDKQVDPILLKLVFHPIEEMIDHEENRVSQRSLSYYQHLLKSLLRVTEPAVDDKEIYYLLMYLNFNSFEFHRYCHRKLQHKLAQQPDNASRLVLLNEYEKTILANPVKSAGIALNPHEASWAERILVAIREEKKALIPGHKPLMPITTKESKEGEAEAIPSSGITKLETSLTAHELALMVRLYIDAGIITNVSLKVVMGFITTFLSTKNTRNLARPSFKTKYYKPSLATVRSCNEWFKKLQAKLAEYPKNDDK